MTDEANDRANQLLRMIDALFVEQDRLFNATLGLGWAERGVVGAARGFTESDKEFAASCGIALAGDSVTK